MFRKAEGVLTPQEAEELGVKVQGAKRAIAVTPPRPKGGRPSKLESVPACDTRLLRYAVP
jgi:hypothetical protein